MITINIKGFNVLLDDEDADRISKLSFWLNTSNYARTGNAYFLHSFWENGRNRNEHLHRMILLLEDKNLFVDHKNGNTLDNRKENLRICTKSENMRNRGKQKNNTSGFKGVSFHKTRKKWRATLMIFRKNVYSGLFHTKEEAHLAYCEAAKKYHGEFARTE